MIEEILEKVLAMSEDKLAEVPGTQHVREELLATAQGYYDDLNAKQQVAPEAVARAAFSLGRMQASLRRYDAARKSFGEVLAYQEQAAEANPTDAEMCMALADTHYEYAKLGQRLWNERDLEHAGDDAIQGVTDMLDHAAACIKWRTKAHLLAPDNREYTRLLANAQMGLGLAEFEQQQVGNRGTRFVEAEKLIDSSQKMRKGLLAANKDDGEVQADLARGYIALADLRVAEAGSTANDEALLDEAIGLRKQAIKVFEGIPAEAVNMDTRFDLANCYQACGSDYANRGDYQQAEAYFIRMGETLQPELLSNPGVYKLRKGVADAQYNLAQVTLIQADATGLDYLYDCQKTLVNALIVDPRNHDAVNLMLGYTNVMVDKLVKSDSVPDAIRCLEDAKALLNEAKSSAADIEFIEATINGFDERIEELRKHSNAEERTA
jgi:tetratricopeptide (TPR) repeat protein